MEMDLPTYSVKTLEKPPLYNNFLDEEKNGLFSTTPNVMTVSTKAKSGRLERICRGIRGKSRSYSRITIVGGMRKDPRNIDLNTSYSHILYRINYNSR